jgi:hypothetical protein
MSSSKPPNREKNIGKFFRKVYTTGKNHGFSGSYGKLKEV